MTKPTHILVVDDHQQIRESVSRYLERNGLRASTAKDAKEMDMRLARGNYDLVVLDVMMPGESGLSACQRLTNEGGPPVILLTALGEETDRISGLEIGADDYLSKPFNPRELLARIKAVLRRTGQNEAVFDAFSGQLVKFAHLILDTDRQVLLEGNDEKKFSGEVRSENGEISLTTADFKLLTVLLERPRTVLSRDELLDLATGRAGGPLDRTIDNQISRLRRKIEPDLLRPTIIKTIRNGGYSLAADVEILS